MSNVLFRMACVYRSIPYTLHTPCECDSDGKAHIINLSIIVRNAESTNEPNGRALEERHRLLIKWMNEPIKDQKDQ